MITFFFFSLLRIHFLLVYSSTADSTAGKCAISWTINIKKITLTDIADPVNTFPESIYCSISSTVIEKYSVEE